MSWRRCTFRTPKHRYISFVLALKKKEGRAQSSTLSRCIWRGEVDWDAAMRSGPARWRQGALVKTWCSHRANAERDLHAFGRQRTYLLVPATERWHAGMGKASMLSRARPLQSRRASTPAEGAASTIPVSDFSAPRWNSTRLGWRRENTTGEMYYALGRKPNSKREQKREELGLAMHGISINLKFKWRSTAIGYCRRRSRIGGERRRRPGGERLGGQSQGRVFFWDGGARGRLCIFFIFWSVPILFGRGFTSLALVACRLLGPTHQVERKGWTDDHELHLLYVGKKYRAKSHSLSTLVDGNYVMTFRKFHDHVV
jgi:hypothetical protein